MKDLTLKLKIIIGGIIAALVPFIIAGTVTYYRTYSSVEKLAREKSEQIAADLANIVQLTIDEEIKVLTTITDDPQIIRAVASGNFEECESRLKILYKKYKTDYEGILITDTKGIVRSEAVDRNRIGLDLSDREYFKTAMSGKTNIGVPVISRASGNLIIVICGPVYSRKNVISGTAGLVLNIDFLKKIITSIKIGRTGYPFMIDGSGLVIIHPNNNFILKENINNYPGMKIFSKRILSHESGSESYIYNGINKVAGFSQVKGPGWSIAVTQNMDEIMAPARSILQFMIISGFIFLIAALSGIILFSVKISTPVEKSLETLSQLTFHSAEVVINIDYNKKILSVNPAAEKLTGYASSDMVNRKITFNSINDIPDEKIWQILYSGKAWSGRIIKRKKNSEEVTLEVLIIPVKNEKQQVTGFIQIGRDITNELVLENRIIQAQKIEAIGTLAGGIAHDFNNILGGIFGYAELCLRNLNDRSRIKKNVEEIIKASERAREMINQILTFSRRKDFELKPVQPGKIIAEAVKLLRATIPATIDINTMLDSDSSILGDPTQLHQVIINLCTNAAYAMTGKGGLIEIRLEDIDIDAGFAEQHPGIDPGRHLILKISDTGPGIEPEKLEHIFEPFYTTKPQGEGTGLGLSVVYGIIKKFKGIILTYSEPGKGVTFNIILPRISAENISEGITIPPHITGGTESIMFIDDETSITETSRNILENLGYSVSAFTDSMKAMGIFIKNPSGFDLIITDYTMPQLTGIELAVNIKSIRGDIPVIISSGYITKEMEKQFRDVGINGILKKPVTLNELAVSIRKILDKQ